MTTRRAATIMLGTLLTFGVAVTLVLRSIEPQTYVAMTDDLEHISVVLLWAAAIGQTGFVTLWLTLPWFTHWVGRALMVKSLALATYLDFALVVHYLAPFPALMLLGVLLFGFITVGIWSQFVTIAYQVFRHGGRAEAVDDSKRIRDGHGSYVRDRED